MRPWKDLAEIILSQKCIPLVIVSSSVGENIGFENCLHPWGSSETISTFVTRFRKLIAFLVVHLGSYVVARRRTRGWFLT